jgi:hypothetical protein
MTISGDPVAPVLPGMPGHNIGVSRPPTPANGTAPPGNNPFSTGPDANNANRSSSPTWINNQGGQQSGRPEPEPGRGTTLSPNSIVEPEPKPVGPGGAAGGNRQGGRGNGLNDNNSRQAGQSAGRPEPENHNTATSVISLAGPMLLALLLSTFA